MRKQVLKKMNNTFPALVEIDLGDILMPGEESLFIDDDSQLLLIKGTPGQQVNLCELLPAESEPGDWMKARGSVTVDGVQYEVYHHSGIETELLVQTGLDVVPQT